MSHHLDWLVISSLLCARLGLRECFEVSKNDCWHKLRCTFASLSVSYDGVGFHSLWANTSDQCQRKKKWFKFPIRCLKEPSCTLLFVFHCAAAQLCITDRWARLKHSTCLVLIWPSALPIKYILTLGKMYFLAVSIDPHIFLLYLNSAHWTRRTCLCDAGAQILESNSKHSKTNTNSDCCPKPKTKLDVSKGVDSSSRKLELHFQYGAFIPKTYCSYFMNSSSFTRDVNESKRSVCAPWDNTKKCGSAGKTCLGPTLSGR